MNATENGKNASGPQGRTPAAGMQEAPSPQLEPGKRVGEFEILRPLGHGAFARVYLARQHGLDRDVALKASTCSSEEARTLAALEHEHIVPIFSQHCVGEYRLLAMRYVPGTTLAQLLAWLTQRNRKRLSEEELLEHIRSGEPQAACMPDPVTHGPRNADFTTCTCRLIAEIAEALHYAHRRGILHCDVKPENILVTPDGRAMLTDFNVAVASNTAANEFGALGGTIEYMSPEQLARMLPGLGTGRVVDSRSDVFSLGTVLFELLTGYHPFACNNGIRPKDRAVQLALAARLQGPPPVNGAARGLATIITKALAHDPAERYSSAAEMAADLRHWLDRRPSQFVECRALAWARRHRRCSLGLTATVAIAAVWLVAGVGMQWTHLCRAEHSLAALQTQLHRRDALAAAAKFRETGRHLAHTGQLLLSCGGAGRRAQVEAALDALKEPLARLAQRRFEQGATWQRGVSGASSHLTAADPLAVYQVLEEPDWESLAPFRLLPAEQRTPALEDVTELLLLRAVAVLQNTSLDRQAARRRALELLEHVPARHQRLEPIARLRRELIGDKELENEEKAESTEFGLYLGAVAEAQRSRDEQAVRGLTASIELRRRQGRSPRFWAYFHRGVCLEHLGRAEPAAADYGVCIGLREDFAWPHYNLGLLFAAQGQLDQAIARFQYALACDDQLGPAYHSLGAALFRLGRFEEALATFDAAIECTGETAACLANRAAARAAIGDRPAALRDLHRALALDPNCKAARTNLHVLAAGE